MATPFIYLSQQQISTLSAMRIDGKYPDAYNHMRDIVQQERIQTIDNSRRYDLFKLENWLDRASSINSDDGSFSSEYVRGATIGIRERLGKPLTEMEFQKASDMLANKVLNDVISSFGISGFHQVIF
jgi:hypothetical protein